MNKDSSEFKQKTIKAMAWSGSLQSLAQLANFLLGIVLARLLTPNDFGLVAMILVFVSFADILTNFGLSSALIQKKDLSQKHYVSSFWFNVIVGLILTLLLYFCSESIAQFYNSPKVEYISKWLSVVFILGAISAVPRAILSKNLEHKKIALIEFLASSISGIVAVICAIKGLSYWSLVVLYLTRYSFRTIAIYVASGLKINFFISIKYLKELFSFSAFVFSTQCLRKAAVQADKVLIAKFVDTVTLGLYSTAHQFMAVPTKNVSQVVASVMFPAFSSIQNDKARIANIYLKAIAVIGLITFPSLLGIALVAPYFIEIVFGEHWLAMTPYLRFFCLMGIFTSVASISGTIYLSLNKASLQLKVNLINQPLQLLGALIGVQFGIEGLMIGYFIAYFISVLITWSFVAKLLEISLLCIIKQFSPLIAPLVLMASIVGIIHTYYLQLSSLYWNFFILIFSGVLSYLVALFLLKPKPYLDLLQVLQNRKNK